MSSPAVLSVPVRWHRVIERAETLAAATGYGLAHTWHLIHSEQLGEAERHLDELEGSLFAAWRTVTMPDCHVCGKPISRTGGATQTALGFRHENSRCPGYGTTRDDGIHYWAGDTLARALAGGAQP